jgi:hypothetical protein
MARFFKRNGDDMMVYLNVFDRIFEHLEEIGIVDDVIKYAEDVLKPMLSKVKGNLFYNEFVLEFALFNYVHENLLLIEYLSGDFYDSLDEDDQRFFGLIAESERHSLEFQKREKTSYLDTKGFELYDFFFMDADSKETKIVISSSPLLQKESIINARLIQNPIHEGKYSIIGGITDKETYDAIANLSMVKFAMERMKESRVRAKEILRFCKEHTLEEIESLDDIKSRFPLQEKEIMKINKEFIEKFGDGFDGYLSGFFGHSNDVERFILMTKHYLSVYPSLKKAISGSNLTFGIPLLIEDIVIRGFLAFIEKESVIVEECLKEMRSEAKREFEISRKNERTLTREKIIGNQLRFLQKNVNTEKSSHFDTFIERLKSYSADQISQFLSEEIAFLKENEGALRKSEDYMIILTLEEFLGKTEDIPYLNTTLEEQKNENFNSEEFYNWIDVADEVLSLMAFLSAIDLIRQGEWRRAYDIVMKNKIMKTDSFEEMFSVGKILSFFEDEEYKEYFNKAKKINKEKYKISVQKFLEEKEQKILSIY